LFLKLQVEKWFAAEGLGDSSEKPGEDLCAELCRICNG
jgi:hypothetical protein